MPTWNGGKKILKVPMQLRQDNTENKITWDRGKTITESFKRLKANTTQLKFRKKI